MQPAGYTPPRPQRQNRRRPRTLIMIGTLVVLTALIILVLMLDANSRQPYPLRDVMIPSAQMRTLETPQAMRYDLRTAQAAQEYFDRLLDSKYVGIRGDTPSLPLPDGDGWAACEANSDGSALTASFDSQGIIASLSVNAERRSAMKPAKPAYRLGLGDESLFNYIRTFAYEYLPDVAIVSGAITADQVNDEGRFITVIADSQKANGAFEFVVQIDPVIRIVGFRILVDKELAYVRTSRMAQAEGQAGQTQPNAAAEPVNTNTAVQLARDALVQALGLEESVVAGFVLVDISRYTNETGGYSSIESPAYYVISFRLPETDAAFFSDYAVFIDEATGEILRILDPSNISNG